MANEPISIQPTSPTIADQIIDSTGFGPKPTTEIEAPKPIALPFGLEQLAEQVYTQAVKPACLTLARGFNIYQGADQIPSASDNQSVMYVWNIKGENTPDIEPQPTISLAATALDAYNRAQLRNSDATRVRLSFISLKDQPRVEAKVDIHGPLPKSAETAIRAMGDKIIQDIKRDTVTIEVSTGSIDPEKAPTLIGQRVREILDLASANIIDTLAKNPENYRGDRPPAIVDEISNPKIVQIATAQAPRLAKAA